MTKQLLGCMWMKAFTSQQKRHLRVSLRAVQYRLAYYGPLLGAHFVLPT